MCRHLQSAQQLATFKQELKQEAAKRLRAKDVRFAVERVGGDEFGARQACARRGAFDVRGWR